MVEKNESNNHNARRLDLDVLFGYSKENEK